MIGKGSREGTCEARLRYFGELFVPSFRFEVDFFSLAYTRALLSHAPCPAPLRHAGARARVHTCGPRTHARCSSLPAGVAWRPRSASSCRRPGRPVSLLPGRACLGDALRLFPPPGRPFPSLSGHLPRTLSVGLSLSPRSPSRAPGPGPPAGPSAPHARPWPTRPAAPVARASARRVASLAEDERGSSSPDPGGRLVSHPRFGEYSLWSSFFP